MAREPEDNEIKRKTGALAGEVLALARDSILVSLRFLDVALLGVIESGEIWMDGENLLTKSMKEMETLLR